MPVKCIRLVQNCNSTLGASLVKARSLPSGIRRMTVLRLRSESKGFLLLGSSFSMRSRSLPLCDRRQAMRLR